MKTFNLIMSLGLVALAASACSSKPKPDPMILACPEEAVSHAQSNQRFVDRYMEGDTSTIGLRDVYPIKRKATLERNGEVMRVMFLQVGIPGCPWVMAEESITPVVVQNGTVKAVGTLAVKEMVGKGWVMKEAKWPWQNYEFGYLPRK